MFVNFVSHQAFVIIASNTGRLSPLSLTHPAANLQ